MPSDIIETITGVEQGGLSNNPKISEYIKEISRNEKDRLELLIKKTTLPIFFKRLGQNNNDRYYATTHDSCGYFQLGDCFFIIYPKFGNFEIITEIYSVVEDFILKTYGQKAYSQMVSALFPEQNFLEGTPSLKNSFPLLDIIPFCNLLKKFRRQKKSLFIREQLKGRTIKGRLLIGKSIAIQSQTSGLQHVMESTTITKDHIINQSLKAGCLAALDLLRSQDSIKQIYEPIIKKALGQLRGVSTPKSKRTLQFKLARAKQLSKKNRLLSHYIKLLNFSEEFIKRKSRIGKIEKGETEKSKYIKSNILFEHFLRVLFENVYKNKIKVAKTSKNRTFYSNKRVDPNKLFVDKDFDGIKSEEVKSEDLDETKKFIKDKHYWKVILDILLKFINDEGEKSNEYAVLDAKYSFKRYNKYLYQISNYMGFIKGINKGALVYLNNGKKDFKYMEGYLYGKNVKLYEFYFNTQGSLEEWKSWAKNILDEMKKLEVNNIF